MNPFLVAPALKIAFFTLWERARPEPRTAEQEDDGRNPNHCTIPYSNFELVRVFDESFY
jgi:hypothetical protein